MRLYAARHVGAYGVQLLVLLGCLVFWTPLFVVRQRFDLALSFKRMDRSQAEKGYDGPVVVCAVRYVPLVISGALIVLFSIEHIIALLRGAEVEPAWH